MIAPGAPRLVADRQGDEGDGSLEFASLPARTEADLYTAHGGRTD